MVEENPNSPAQVGRRLYLLRMALEPEKTQTDWVASIGDRGITPQHWKNWESGRNKPSGSPLRSILRRTGATSDYVLFGNRGSLKHELVLAIEAVEALEAGESQQAG